MSEFNITNENTMRECRKTQIRLLDALDKICQKNNLTYWLDFGTLLGAVRTKSFIPWDDDIDVSMPIKDYEKFLVIAEKELPDNIFLQTPKTDAEYKQAFAKLRDCYSTFLEHHEDENTKYHKGIYIDIFPSVYYPKMPFLFRKVLLYFTVRARHKAIVQRKNTFINYMIYYFCKFIWLLFSPFKTNGVAQTPEDNGYYYSIPDTYIYPLKKIEFEGKLYPSPTNVSAYLTLMYGKDYMTPPPMDKRIAHAKLILPNTPCGHLRSMVKQ